MPSAVNRIFRVSALAGLAVFGVMMMHPVGARADDDSSESRIRQGFAIALVPLNLKGRN